MIPVAAGVRIWIATGQAAIDAGLEAIKAGKAFTFLKEIKIGLEDFRVMVIQPWDGWFAEDVRVEYAGAYGPASFDVNTRELIVPTI